MQQKFGILILPDTHTVHDVRCDQWSEEEIQSTLGLGNGRVLRREVERTGDAMYVSAFLNDASMGEGARCDGFDLHGERFYGPALIVAANESAVSPLLDPHDICRAIHFFRLDKQGVATGRQRSLSAVSR